MAAPKLGLDETMELLTRVLGARDEDPDLSALSAALKAKLGLSELKKPLSTMSPGVELMTRGVKSCTPLDTCPSPIHPRVRTVPVCSIGGSTEGEMKGYGLAALAPLATVYPSPPSGGKGDTGVPRRGMKGIATATFQIELSKFHPKNFPQRAEEFSEFLLLTGQQHADVRTRCTLIKKSCKKKFLQRQLKTAIRKSSSWEDFLKRLEQMYPVYGDGDGEEERDKREQDQARGVEGREPGLAAGGREDGEEGEEGVEEGEAEGGGQESAVGDRLEEESNGERIGEGSEREGGKRGREADEQDLHAEQQQEGKGKGGQEGNGRGESGTGKSSGAVKSRGRCWKG